MMEEIGAALLALKTAFELSQAAVKFRDDHQITAATELFNERIREIKIAMSQLQDKIMAQQQDIAALHNIKRELEEKIVELTQRQLERGKYQLAELDKGVFVLALIQSDEAEKAHVPMHYLCQRCLDNFAQKVVLQTAKEGGVVWLCCPSCKNRYATAERYQPPPGIQFF